jgi:hypothetical protein
VDPDPPQATGQVTGQFRMVDFLSFAGVGEAALIVEGISRP